MPHPSPVPRIDGLARLAADETVDYRREYTDLGNAVVQARFASERRPLPSPVWRAR